MLDLCSKMITTLIMNQLCCSLQRFHVINRNEDRDERSRKASYDVKEGTADCEDWYVDFTGKIY